jgi:hypothetical protein
MYMFFEKYQLVKKCTTWYYLTLFLLHQQGSFEPSAESSPQICAPDGDRARRATPLSTSFGVFLDIYSTQVKKSVRAYLITLDVFIRQYLVMTGTDRNLFSLPFSSPGG